MHAIPLSKSHDVIGAFAGNGGCGIDSATSFPVYLEYITGDMNFLLAVLRYKGYLDGMYINEVLCYIWPGPHPLLVLIFILFAYLYLPEATMSSSLGLKQVVLLITSRHGSWTMLHCCSHMKLIHHCWIPLTGHCRQELHCFTQGAELR